MKQQHVYSRRKPSIPRMIVKLLLALFLGLFLYAGALVALDDAEDASFRANEAQMVNFCDRYYYAKDYGGLYDELILYDLYSDTYEIYWEVVNGYNDYICWQQWSRLDDAKAATYRTRVAANAEHCRFEKNRKALDGWKTDTEKKTV